MTNMISRRTLAKAAVWSVPIAAVAAGAPSAEAAAADCISSGTLTNSASGIPTTANYTCVQTDQNGKPTGVGLGAWKVQIKVATCTAAHAGATLKTPPKITANVTTSAAAGNVLRGLGATQVTGGSSKATYKVSGQVANPGARTGNLTIGKFPVPASGGITTTATGNGALETATTKGSISIAATNFTVVLNWTGSDPDTGDAIKGTSYIQCTTGTSATPASSVPLSPAITVQ